MITSKPMPVLPEQRIEQIDILRGFALFGILLVNIFGYHASFYHFSDFYQALADPFQKTLYQAMVNFGSDKFIFSFSILFGYGFWMMYNKFQHRGDAFAGFYTHRMLWLCVIGMLHILMFWAGDILFIYGILGLLLLALRKLNSGSLIGIALFFYFFTAWYLLLRNYFPALPDPMSTLTNIPMDKVVDVYANGNFIQIFLFRFNEYLIFRNINLLYYAPKVFSLFILGYLAGRANILNVINRSTKTSLLTTVVLLLFGLVIILRLENILHFFSNPDDAVFLSAYIFIYEIGNCVLGLGYLMLILVIAQTKIGLIILSPFKYAGRMALSNYLLQSIVFTTVFYGYGFGLFGGIQPSEFLLWAALFFAIQIIFSSVWLSKFKFGPMEFAWRRMTYGYRK